MIGEYVSSRSNREYTVAIAVFPIKEEEERRKERERKERWDERKNGGDEVKIGRASCRERV